MNGSFLGEALILVLLIFNSTRAFFLKYSRIDSLAVLAPISVVLAVLQILAWGIDVFALLLLIISVFAFFTNFRALLRLASGLYVDHYSVAFRIGEILVLLASVFELGLLIYFRPVYLNAKNYNVNVQKVRLGGSFSGGFFTVSAFENPSANMWIIQPVNEKDFNGGIIALLTDKRADISDYAPYTFSLAKKGFKVYAVDFYARDLKWFYTMGDVRYFRRLFMLFSYFKNPVKFELEKEFYTYNSMQEMNAVLEIIKQNENADAERGANIYADDEYENEENTAPVITEKLNGNTVLPLFVGDWMTEIALQDFEKLHRDEICGVFYFAAEEEYPTPGFGFVEQTRPLVAYALGKRRNANLEKTAVLVEKTAALIPIVEKSASEESETQFLEADFTDETKILLTNEEGSIDNDSL